MNLKSALAILALLVAANTTVAADSSSPAVRSDPVMERYSAVSEKQDWKSAAGECNFPDGEVFTGPVEDATRGTVRFSFPAIYGGSNIGNFGADIPVANGRFQARVPANGVLVFQKR